MSGPVRPAGDPIPWAQVSETRSDGAFEVEMDEGFAIAEGVCNGGYVLAVIHQVALTALTGLGAGTTSAVAVSSQFLAPTAPGSATVRVVRIQTGRTLSRVEVELDSNGRSAVRAVILFLTPSDPSRQLWQSVDPPVLSEPADCRPMPSAPADCRPMPSAPGGSFAWPTMYQDRIELRVDPATSGFLDGRPSGRGEIKTWWSARDPRVMDAGVLLLALDAMPPGTMELKGVTSGSPTVQLEARLYCDGAGLASVRGPFIVRQQVLTAGPVTADQVCEVWDRSGRILASATQVNWLL